MDRHPTPADIAIPTPRLRLRAIEPADAAGIFAMRQDPAIVRRMDLPVCASLAEAEAYVVKRIAMMADNICLYWAITERETGSFAGSICLWNYRLEEGVAEIGYEVLPACQGRGYATEAIRAVTAYATTAMGFRAVDATPDTSNLPSARVLERCGFRLVERVPHRHLDGSDAVLLRYLWP